jgi:uncharacterized damage-inducible protein DinB
MFRSVSDFTSRFQYESQATAKLFEALTEESLNQAIANDHRTIGRIAWHIVTTYPEMAGQMGIPSGGVDHTAPVPSLEEIKSAYDKVTQALSEAVGKWSEGDLLKVDNLYGEEWERGKTLLILLVHEAHHRGQMTVLMRQAGLKVPGVYGPSMEEWANFGGKPPVV